MNFKRNLEGKLDLEKGEYSTDECRKLDCKFEQEGKFGLGCALVEVQAHDGSWLERGEKCPMFDYSGRTLIRFQSLISIIS